MDKIIYESANFSLTSVEKPHITRVDGGHIKVTPKKRFSDRLELTPQLATEMAWITMLGGEAMTNGLRKQGIDIGIINYQDNKNWSVFSPEGPYLHIHLYGRAKNATIQKYGDACNFPHRETGFYDSFQPLNDEDVKAIRDEIDKLLLEEKYNTKKWHM